MAWALNRYFDDRLQWHLAMAEDGDAESQFFLSGSYDDEEIALHWLIQAAENGHVSAQYNLGAKLIPIDLEQAFMWLFRAALQGSKPALAIHSRMARLTNSGPLSERMNSGAPWTLTAYSDPT